MPMDITLSLRKKRCPSTGADEALVTPKKLRVQAYALPTPRSSTPSASKSSSIPTLTSAIKPKESGLPSDLHRLLELQATLQQVLSHALATSGISPTEDRGYVPNVINHISLRKQGYNLDDLRRLAWLWQWDAKSLPTRKDTPEEDGDNPFVEKKEPLSEERVWSVGTAGIIITPATHCVRETGKRVAVYGIGIEVEMNIDKGYSDGMAAIARWTADGKKRQEAIRKKLLRWVELRRDATSIPLPPQLSVPALKAPSPLKTFSLTPSRLTSRSPSPTKAMGSPSLLLQTPHKSKAIPKTVSTSPERQDQIPFPMAPPSDSIPQTPSRKANFNEHSGTPASTSTDTPSTVRTVRTPSSERRSALYERVRQRSLSNTPMKSPTKLPFSRERLKAMGADLMRRRVLLGRLPNVAESIWMLFSGPASSLQERRALRLPAVVHSVVKSTSVPISNADAEESISLLIELCPFFLKKLTIGREEWLEMPAPEPKKEVESGSRESEELSKSDVPPSVTSSPRRIRVPTSPGMLNRGSTEVILSHLSPRSVGTARGGLHRVRELIRKELESYD